MYNNLYSQLTGEFEQRLKRSLTEKEKLFIQWMVELQNNINNNKP